MKEGKLLIVDDNRNVLKALRLFLDMEFAQVDTADRPDKLRQLIPQGTYDVLLLDMNFTAGKNSGAEGIFWLREAKKWKPDLQVVMMTAYGDISLAVQALKDGAADFVLKPWDNEKMIATLKAAYRLKKSQEEVAGLQQREMVLKKEMNPVPPTIIARSESMKSVLSLVKKVAPTEANVLITGENGTGKEVVAKEIHHSSQRSHEIFVQVDLSSLAESLFESELFGHTKGAFTDAREDRMGKLMLADKGTLFLDEIGNLPMHLQSKLLTVLQTRQLTPLGSNKPMPFNVRLVCATNKDLVQMVKENLFRQDLLYRINTIHIHLPSLRERPGDIEELATHYLNLFSKKYNKAGMHFGEGVVEQLKRNPWPGNIREFMNAIEKAVILAEGLQIKTGDFSFMPQQIPLAETQETLEETEKRMVQNALLRNPNNLSAAASALGITRPTLYKKIQKYGL